MALGGGTFTTQNKILPGSYINFISAAVASSNLSERGVSTMPVELDWGPEGTVFTVEASDFKKNSLELLGYGYQDEKLSTLRELFLHSTKVHLFRLGTGGVKASNDYATALYPGIRGNEIKIVIEPGEGYTDSDPVYSVSTYVDANLKDMQTVKAASELVSNAFVAFKTDAVLALTAGTPLTGGVNGTVTGDDHQSYLDKIESYNFNAMGCPSEDDTVKALYVEFTRRIRDEVGMKFQCVVHRYAGADYEGVISVENNDTPQLVAWVTGAAAGCAVNASLTGSIYNGEYTVNVDYTQYELEKALKAGKFVFHRVGDEIWVLDDVNTFLTYTEDKGKDFSSNQTIRVLDQIATDIAVTFNTKYLGKIPNNAAGRVSLWNDIVAHHQELEKIQAIENFSSDNVVVEQGNTKKSVVVSDVVTPVNAMTQLYMTVVVA